MTLMAQLRLQVRALAARVDVLEAAACRPARRKRERAPRPTDGIIATREAQWAKYLRLEMMHGHGRTKLSKLAFAIRHRLNPDEFCRWFSATDRRGVPAGSGPDVRFRQALTDAISELEGRAVTGSVAPHSHGRMPPSQNSSVRLQ